MQTDLIRATILDEMIGVAASQKIALPPLLDDLELRATGLDSLCFALLVGRLYERLGIDPFDVEGEIILPLTVGEMVEFYARGRSEGRKNRDAA